MKLASIVEKSISTSQRLQGFASSALENYWNKLRPEFWRIVDSVSHRLLIPEDLQEYVCEQYDLSVTAQKQS